MTGIVRPHRVAALCLAAVVLAGCGETADTGGDSTPSGSPDGSTAVCSDVEALEKSVRGLRDTSLDQGALAKISEDLDTIQKQVATLKDDAKDEYSSEIDQLSSAVDTLSTSVNAATENPTSSTLATVASSLRGVGTAARGLQSAVAGSC